MEKRKRKSETKVGVEFHNVGGWLTHGDLALGAGVDFSCCC